MSESTGQALYGAFLLARGRPEGMTLIVAPPQAEAAVAARSFWSMALCLPAFLCLHLIDWAETGLPPAPGRAMTLDLLAYAVGWLGFALLSHRLALGMGRAALWPRFVTAWNWCNLIQYLMLVLACLPGLFGLPGVLAQTVWLVAMGWALWLEWYATRLALEIDRVPAAGLVAMDFAIGVLMVGLTGLMD